MEKQNVSTPEGAESKPTMERWGVHYDSIPHTCRTPEQCDCNCSGCVKARGFPVTVENGGQCKCDYVGCPHCSVRIARRVMDEGAESAKEKVLKVHPDAFCEPPSENRDCYSIWQGKTHEDWFRGLGQGPTEEAAWVIAAQHPSVSPEGKQEGASEILTCSCDARIVQLDHPSGDYWAPESKPYEVCIDNHWHKPVEGKQEEPAAVSGETVDTVFDKLYVHVCKNAGLLECSHLVTRDRPETMSRAWFTEGWNAARAASVAPQPQTAPTRICPLCNGKGCEYCVDGRYVDENDLPAPQPLSNGKPDTPENRLLLRWNQAAGSVGICGSEYVDDPERVFERVKENRDTLMRVLRSKTSPPQPQGENTLPLLGNYSLAQKREASSWIHGASESALEDLYLDYRERERQLLATQRKLDSALERVRRLEINNGGLRAYIRGDAKFPPDELVATDGQVR